MPQSLDYTKHYSSLADEDLGRLSQDVQSLTPDARMALKAEMERRQLSAESIDWTAQPTTATAAEPVSGSSGGFRRFLRNFLIFAACDVAYVLIVGGVASMVNGIDIEALATSLTTTLLKLSVALALITTWRPSLKPKTIWIIGAAGPAIAIVFLLILGHVRQTMNAGQ
ncbi:MAG TPA: hypothetical protein VME86_15380 [Acidobacteriaceae bacterium]|nr:hypothetical protein [Acidobacteriaceae bacterium]